MKNDLLEQSNQYANLLISKTLRIGSLLMVITAIANYFELFVINGPYMMSVVMISVLGFFVPTLLFDVLQIHKLWAQLLVLGLMAGISGIMYAILSYHVVTMFVLPVCISCLYNHKRYPIFTMLITIPIIILSHFVAFHLKIVPDEPLITLKGVVNYGIVPRIIQFIGCSLVCIAASDRSHQLIVSLLKAQEKQEQAQKLLRQVIFESEQFISIRHLEDMLQQAIQSVKAMLQHMGSGSDAYIAGCITAYQASHYTLFTSLKPQGIAVTAENLSSHLTLNGQDLSSDLFEDQGCEISLKEHVLLMKFYDDHQLIAFIAMACTLDADGEALTYLKTLYTNIQKSLKNALLDTELLMTQKQLIQSLAEICESKSSQTGQHIKRVGEYMKIMGKELGLSEENCDILCMAAMLHDVGKLTVPDAILEKKGKLTAEEFEEIKKHVDSGRRLLEHCPGEIMAIGKTIAYQHHEKWDGSGYLGLKGKEIDFYASLVAVIDVFDALVSKRSYKEAWDIEQAYEEILSCKGTHFSPEAISIFQSTYPQLIKVLEAYPD